MTLKEILIAGKLTISEGGGGGSDWRKKDGKTYLHIRCDLDFLRDVYLKFGQTVASGNTIDWGDGSTTTPENTTAAYIHHQYSTAGDHVITITNNSGYFFFGEEGTTKGYIFGDGINNGNNDKYKNYTSILRKVEIGKGWKADKQRQIADCPFMTDFYVSVKPDQTAIGANMFGNCFSLREFGGVDGWADGITTVGNNFMAITYSQPIPFFFPNVKQIPDGYYQSNSSVTGRTIVISIPDGVTTIGANAFTCQRGVFIIDIPETVTSIGNGAFNQPYGAHAIIVRAETPPTLGGTNTFGSFGANVYNPKIYVPFSSDHSILAAYQTAWSNLSSYLTDEPAPYV